MIILGIDPGYAIIGWGIVEYNANKFKTIDYGAITTEAHTPFKIRLETIYRELDEIISRFHPDVAAMEKLYYNTNAKTVIDVAQARGVITLTIQLRKLELCEYTPLQIKQSVTGYGRADKNQVQQMTKLILNLKSIPRPDDTADALAVAICHGNSSSSILDKINGDL